MPTSAATPSVLAETHPPKITAARPALVSADHLEHLTHTAAAGAPATTTHQAPPALGLVDRLQTNTVTQAPVWVLVPSVVVVWGLRTLHQDMGTLHLRATENMRVHQAKVIARWAN